MTRSDSLRQHDVFFDRFLAMLHEAVLIVSLGSNHGFKAGDRLKVYKPQLEDGKPVVDDKGVALMEFDPAGEIVLEAVQDGRSKASYTGSEQIEKGWFVQLK